MLRKVFISELAENAVVDTAFLLSAKSLREARNGNPYLTVTLTDATGSIEARAWDNAHALDAQCPPDSFVQVRGRVASYRDQMQIQVSEIWPLGDHEVDLADFLPRSRWSAKALWQQLEAFIEAEIASSEVRRFLGLLLARPAIAHGLQTAPAATNNHHHYIGGLLEHSLSMARLAVGIARHYSLYYPAMIDQDLLLAGCIIHDLGKIEELTYRRSFTYSTEGRLTGHIPRGLELVHEISLEAHPPLPASLILELKHLVLSHHGKLEFGSPVVPRTPEAILLNQIDMIDSRMNMCHVVLAKLSGTGSGDGQGRWSDYSRPLEGAMYMRGTEAQSWSRARAVPQDLLEGPGFAPALEAPLSPPANTGPATALPASDAHDIAPAPVPPDPLACSGTDDKALEAPESTFVHQGIGDGNALTRQASDTDCQIAHETPDDGASGCLDASDVAPPEVDGQGATCEGEAAEGPPAPKKRARPRPAIGEEPSGPAVDNVTLQLFGD